MPNYENATMKTCTFESMILTIDSAICDVTLDGDGSIRISVQDTAAASGITVYQGKENGAGHYHVTGKSPAFQGSLHRFPGSMILEGYWEKDKQQGMWRIELDEVLDDVTGEPANEIFEPVKVDEGNEDDEDDLLLKGEDEYEDDGWTSKPRRYRFPLRDDWDVSFTLPDDMNRREGKRLASFVKSLSHF